MKEPNKEFVYEKKIDSVDGFTKEYDGISGNEQSGLQEVWNTGNDEGQADAKQRS